MDSVSLSVWAELTNRTKGDLTTIDPSLISPRESLQYHHPVHQHTHTHTHSHTHTHTHTHCWTQSGGLKGWLVWHFVRAQRAAEEHAERTHSNTHAHCVDRDAWRDREMLRKLVCKKICARKNDAFYVSSSPSLLSSCVFLLSCLSCFLSSSSLLCFLWPRVSFLHQPVAFCLHPPLCFVRCMYLSGRETCTVMVMILSCIWVLLLCVNLIIFLWYFSWTCINLHDEISVYVPKD